MPARRRFLAAALLTAASYRRVLGANARVPVGVIGCGGRGRDDARHLLAAGADIVAAADPDPGQLAKLQPLLPRPAEVTADFRRLLDRKDVSAVLVATPDHWHALPAVLACQAGKDLYLEKPTAYSVAESRAIVTAARKHDRVVAVGTQQRSGEHYKRAAELVRGGGLGTVSRARFWNVWNVALGGRGRGDVLPARADGPPPAGVDYDLWLGPAPARPFNPNRFHWNYVYFWDYAGGMMSGWGIHHTDVIHWLTGRDAPTAVTAAGGRFVTADPRETPDTLDVLLEYPGLVVQGSMYHGTARPIEGEPYGVALYGTKGTLVITRAGYTVHPEGGGEPQKVAGGPQDGPHAADFLARVADRKRPAADIETGHRSTIPVLLANIAYRTGRRLAWDAAAERFVGDRDADTYLSREYRKPWALPG